jgi:hypothetical protein
MPLIVLSFINHAIGSVVLRICGSQAAKIIVTGDNNLVNELFYNISCFKNKVKLPPRCELPVGRGNLGYPFVALLCGGDIPFLTNCMVTNFIDKRIVLIYQYELMAYIILDYDY